MTAKQAIVERLRYAGRPVAIHELGLIGFSETALSARTRELARAGIIKGERREGKAFKEWSLVEASCRAQ